MKPFLKVAVAAAAGLMMTSVNASAAAGTEKSAIAPESVGSMSMDALQRRFVDLRFGMFIHFNMPTFVNEDWPDPDASPELFNPGKLDCRQWAKAAKSAGMTYGCLTTKHHSGFCIWDTKTTDYSVMSSPLKRDVVKEYVDAFRAEGLDVMLYFSILDTHAHLRPGWITPEHTELVKNQLRELLTNYGKITALIIDGWDAPWSRISYDEIPFEEIYALIKSIQPECLVMDLNAAKYPTDALFYTDIKSYEQGAGQKIDKKSNALPALSCYPIQKNWFWKTTFPTAPLKNVDVLVNENIVPMGKAYCNFILNVAPNRDGLMDENALKALKQIGKSGRRLSRALRPRQHWRSHLTTGLTMTASPGAPLLSLPRTLPNTVVRTVAGVTIWRFLNLLVMTSLSLPGLPMPLLREILIWRYSWIGKNRSIR